MYDQYLKVAYESLSERIAEVADYMALGKCKDFADYQNKAGMLEGLRLAQGDLHDPDERVRKASDGGMEEHLDETGNTEDSPVGYT